MTEQDWLAATDPHPLFEFLGRSFSDRKTRLYECACCRRVWDALEDPRSRNAIGIAEKHADGLATDEEMEAAANAASKAWPKSDWEFEEEGYLHLSAAAYNAALPWGYWGGAPAFREPSSIIEEAVDDPVSELEAQADILRDLVNPFHQGAFDPSWNNAAIQALAQRMYDTRHFTAMSDLANALEEAGCTDAAILWHCRAPGVHYRGCWVVDAILGKS